MFSKSAAYYDLIYNSIKDYKKESDKIADLIADLHPAAKKILDVACGTGEHAKFMMQNHGFSVDGLDLDQELLAFARKKLPRANLHLADMINFDLGCKFDVITCLFSAIGYVQTLDNVVATLKCFRKHLASHGVIIVEPWFTPDAWLPGTVHVNNVEAKDIKVCRMILSTLEGRISKLHSEYLIGTPQGISHQVENHTLGLFTVDEMKQSFQCAGLKVDFDPQGIFGRGLYVAREQA